jgi:hypothetical protein
MQIKQSEIELIDGPLTGEFRKLHGGLMPEKIGVPDFKWLHWYEILNGRGCFIESEPTQ